MRDHLELALIVAFVAGIALLADSVLRGAIG